MATRTCKNCGFENSTDGKFCKKCGVSLATSKIASAFSTNDSTWVSPVEDRYDNLKSISNFYKVLTFLFGCLALFLAYKAYEITEQWEMVFAVLILCFPISLMIGSQYEKIELSISQEKSMRECVYYLRKLTDQVTNIH